MLSEKEKKQVLDTIFARVAKDDCVIFLFGSQATGEMVRGSDIDIGILSKSAIPAKDFIEIEEDVNNKAVGLKKVDLVDFSTVNEKIKNEALKEIQIWHEGKNCRGLLKSLKRG